MGGLLDHLGQDSRTLHSAYLCPYIRELLLLGRVVIAIYICCLQKSCWLPALLLLLSQSRVVLLVAHGFFFFRIIFTGAY